jgi:hypothetical protein
MYSSEAITVVRLYTVVRLRNSEAMYSSETITVARYCTVVRL